MQEYSVQLPTKYSKAQNMVRPILIEDSMKGVIPEIKSAKVLNVFAPDVVIR